MADTPFTHDSNFYKFDDYSFYYSPATQAHWPEEAHDQVEILVLFDRTGSKQTLKTTLSADSPAKVTWQSSQMNSQRSLFPGQLCIIPAQQQHQLWLSESAEAMLIFLETQFIVRATHETLRTPRWQLSGNYAIQDDTILFLAKSLRSWLAEKSAIAALYRKTLVSLLAVHLIARYAQADLKPLEKADTSTSSKIEPVLTYIHSNLDQELKVSILAELAELSQSHFCRTFKKAVGLAPYRYILSQRISLAKTLLETTALSLADISFQCGFYDQSHFILQFRRFTGSTPKAYRENIVRAGQRKPVKESRPKKAGKRKSAISYKQRKIQRQL